MKNTLLDLNNHLFEQMERLNDEELTDEELEKEIKRSEAMVDISQQIIDNAHIMLKATEINLEYGKNVTPKLLIGNQESSK